MLSGGQSQPKSTLSKPHVGGPVPFSKLGSPNLGLGLPQLIQLRRSRVGAANSPRRWSLLWGFYLNMFKSMLRGI